ncbi:unnamed protein product, partial [Meganyctiphanes norvegica]
MSGPLSSFLIEGEEDEEAPDLQADTLNASEFLGPLSAVQSTTFLSQSPGSTRYTDPRVTATHHDAFLKALAETTGSSEGFLTSMGEGESAVTAAGLLSSGTESSRGSGGSLLYLDPTTGLHVLVHHMPHTSSTTNTIQNSETTPDEFVVVGALQSEQEQHEEEEHQVTVNRNNIVSEYEQKSKSQGMNSERIVSSKVNGKSLQLAETVASSLPLQDGTSTLLSLAETGQEDDMDIESVPHINLQKIIEEIANRDNQQELVNEAIGSGGSITIEGLPDPEGSSGIILVECSDQDQELSEKQSKGLSLKSKQNNLHMNDLFDGFSKTSIRTNNFRKRASKIFLDTSQGLCNEPFDDTIDEDSLYDIVMTYRCKVCSQVFMEKPKLLQHYQEAHKPNGCTKIRIKTLNNSEEMLAGPPSAALNNIKTLPSGT